MNTILKSIRQRLSPQSFPDTAEQLQNSDPFTGWCLLQCRVTAGLIIKDASEAILNETFGKSRTNVVFSPHKFLGVPNAGTLLLRSDTKLPDCGLSPGYG